MSPSVPEMEGMYIIRWHPFLEEVPLVELIRTLDRYLVFTRMPGENYRRRLRSLLCLCDLDLDLDAHCKCDTPTGPNLVSGRRGST